MPFKNYIVNSYSIIQKKHTYDLYGVIHHEGSMDYVHYTATLRMDTNGNDWYLYNGKYASFNFNASFKCIWNND